MLFTWIALEFLTGGGFRDPRVQEVLNRKEGLLINLSLKPDVWGDYIVESAKTSCKIGYSTGHE